MLPSFLVAATLSLAATPAPAAPRSAAEVLALARQAQGGDAWDAVRALRAGGALEAGGLKGSLESLTDVLTGRHRVRYDLGPVKGAEGWDGEAAWSQDASGQSRLEEGDEQRQGAVAEAFRRAQAWWYPSRRAGAVAYGGEKLEGGRRLHVLSVAPAGGRRFELWVDAASGLFDRTVEVVGPETVTTSYSDWRAVGGVKAPFRMVVSRGDPRYDQRIAFDRVEAVPPLEDALFALPAPPPRDFGLAAGRRSTTVPFQLVNNHVYAEVRLDGRGPYRLLVDTGGVNIISPALAKELGLAAEGALPGGGVGEQKEDLAAAKVKRVEIGEAFLRDQTFFVYPIDQLSPVEGVPVLGLVGYEVFRRFPARIDYQRRELTLHDPTGWSYQGPGTAVPFVFDEHTPLVEGEVDGIAGKFAIDTGSRSSLDLMAPFVEKHGLAEKYRAGPERIGGWGVGGASRTRMARLRELRLGGVTVSEPVAGLSTARKGAFANPYVAGNVGGGVLSRFNLVLDYGARRIFFERPSRPAPRDAGDKAGWWIHAARDGFEVKEVVPGSPAAEAGLSAGDVVLSADGQAPPALTLPELRRLTREAPAGTRVKLRVRSASGERQVVLALRDLV